VARAIPDAPLFANMIEGGKTPLLSSAQLQALGYRMVVYPLSGLFAATKAIMETYRELLTARTTAARQDRMVSFHEFEEIIGAPRFRELEQRFATAS
jgi:methylisocitrate lyase